MLSRIAKKLLPDDAPLSRHCKNARRVFARMSDSARRGLEPTAPGFAAQRGDRSHGIQEEGKEVQEGEAGQEGRQARPGEEESREEVCQEGAGQESREEGPGQEEGRAEEEKEGCRAGRSPGDAAAARLRAVRQRYQQRPVASHAAGLVRFRAERSFTVPVAAEAPAPAVATRIPERADGSEEEIQEGEGHEEGQGRQEDGQEGSEKDRQEGQEESACPQGGEEIREGASESQGDQEEGPGQKEEADRRRRRLCRHPRLRPRPGQLCEEEQGQDRRHGQGRGSGAGRPRRRCPARRRSHRGGPVPRYVLSKKAGLYRPPGLFNSWLKPCLR